jgi:predicted DNA-binding transcriptional regulator AlpA
MSTTTLLRAKTVRALLGQSDVTLWRMRREGTGPRWCKIGSRVMYDAEDVERFLKERLSAATQRAA